MTEMRRTLRRVAVTGATGFIGSHLVHSLAEAGVEVLALHRAEHIAQMVPGVEYQQLDLSDCAAVESFDPQLAGVDTLFHLAAEVSWGSELSPVGFVRFQQHVSNPLRLIERLGDTGLRVVLASSLMVYPMYHTDLLMEEADELPHDFYGMHKLMLETALHDWSARTGGSWLGARISHVYGSGMRVNRFLPDIVEAAFAGEPLAVFGDGSTTVDWVDVDDIVRGLMLAGRTHWNGPVNLGSGDAPSYLEIARKAAEHAGRSPDDVQLVPDRPVPIRRQLLDLSRARDTIGYVPEVDFEEGFRRFCEGVR